MEPAGRLTCEELLDHSYFDDFRDWFEPELEVWNECLCSATVCVCVCVCACMCACV